MQHSTLQNHTTQYNAIADTTRRCNTIQCKDNTKNTTCNNTYYHTIQDNTNTTTCNTIQHNSVQYKAIPDNKTQEHTIQRNTTQHNTIAYKTSQYIRNTYNTIQDNTIKYTIQ